MITFNDVRKNGATPCVEWLRVIHDLLVLTDHRNGSNQRTVFIPKYHLGVQGGCEGTRRMFQALADPDIACRRCRAPPRSCVIPAAFCQNFTYSPTPRKPIQQACFYRQTGCAEQVPAPHSHKTALGTSIQNKVGMTVKTAPKGRKTTT